MDFVVKKTTELTEKEKSSLLDCFIEVFDRERTLKEMLNQYLNTPMGYSIHSLCIDEGRVVAAHTAFPSYYIVDGNRVKAFNYGDTMVRKVYRDGVVYLDICINLDQYMRQNCYAFWFGFPNENSYAVERKGKLTIEIGRLDTYILPYRIGKIKRGLGILNPLSVVFCHLWLLFHGLGLKKENVAPLVHKDEETYNESRYKRMDGDYIHIKDDRVEFFYKIKTQEGVRTAFLIDVVGKNERAYWLAVRYILKNEKQRFDLLMHVGHLPIGVKRIGLIKIPRRFEPKHFYMSGKVLDKKQVNKDVIYDIKNWDVNLSDYDLI